MQQKTALAEMRVLFITSNQNCRSREEKLSLRAPKIPFKSTSFLILADVVKFVQKMSVVDRKRVFLKIHSFEPIASSNLKFVSLRENSWICQIWKFNLIFQNIWFLELAINEHFGLNAWNINNFKQKATANFVIARTQLNLRILKM